MALLKRFIFLVFVLLALAAGTWAYLQLKNSKKPQRSALSALPAGALFYARTPDFSELNNRLNTRSLILDDFSHLQSFAEVLDLIEQANQRISAGEEIKGLMKGCLMHFALYAENKSFLLCFNLKELGQENLFRTALVQDLQAKETENGFYSLEISKGKTFFLSLQKGLVCLSDAPGMLQLAEENGTARLMDDRAFAEAQKTFDEEAVLALYVNPALAEAYKSAKKPRLGLLKQGITYANVSVQPSELSLNGYFKPDSTSILFALLSQRNKNTGLFSVLPAHCKAFKHFVVNDFQSLGQNLKSRRDKDLRSFWARAADTALYNVESAFYANLSDGLCEFELEGQEQSCFLTGVKDSVEALEHLGFMSTGSMEHEGTRIYHFQGSGNRRGLQLLSPLSTYSARAGFVFNSCIYLAPSEEEARTLLSALRYGASLDSDPDFVRYAREQFPDEYQVLYYASSAALLKNMRELIPGLTGSKTKYLEGIQKASMSLISRERDYQLRVQLQQESEKEAGGEKMLWTLKLDSSCSRKPWPFVNHLSGEHEVLVQDDGNTLYLLNSKGKVIWKKNLDGKILSEVQMVDMFRNNKYQILFNTANAIHLLDRNGKYVDTYPLKTPARMTSGLSLFDYEGKKDYRLIFACENNRIYNYTLYGIRQEGFTPYRTDARVNLPVQHVRIGESDYLVAMDVEGQIYAFSRKGEGRIRFSNRSLTNCRTFIIDASNSLRNSWIIYFDDKSALINKISFNDKKEILRLNLSTEMSYHSFGLVDENRSADLLVAGHSGISAYNLNGNRIFDLPLNQKQKALDFYSDETHSFYMSLDEHQDLLLFDPAQQISRTLKATALPLVYDLFRTKKICLLVPDQNKLNCLYY
ncbi:MAG TPA: hypothetical protein PLQ93_09445 [Bacteroidia bacterium]|nr:hypothetical protein [Bacteroidia bacterium]